MPDPILSQATAATSTPELSGADKLRAAVEGLGNATEHVPEPEPQVEEPQTTQEPEPEPQAQEPQGDAEPAEGSVEHKIQSWLGRKQAKWAEDIEGRIKGVLDGYFANIPQTQQPQQPQFTPPVEIPDLGENLDDIVTTKREVLELAEKREQAKIHREQQYWGSYSQALTKLGNDYRLNPDQIQEMAKVIASSDQRTHGDPTVAAQLNFQRAYIGMLQQQTKPAAPKVPVNGQPPSSATGIATSQKTDTGAPETIVLDAEAERIKKAFGLSDDTVKRTLKPKK